MDSTYIPDQLFPCDNDIEIPSLRLDMQAESCEIPFVCFGEQKRTFQMNGNGTLHFYTDDYRFTSIYENPGKILSHNPQNIVEPNFSLFNEMPIAFGLQAIYKKRFIARAIQERGIRVFVDLNVAQKYYKLNMIGVPLGWHSFCTRGYSDRIPNLEFEYTIAKEWAQGVEPLFIIYGGGNACRRFAMEHNCIYINPCVTTKKKIDAIKKIHEGIAFFNDDFSIKGLKSISHFDNQIQDFRQQTLKEI